MGICLLESRWKYVVEKDTLKWDFPWLRVRSIGGLDKEAAIAEGRVLRSKNGEKAQSLYIQLYTIQLRMSNFATTTEDWRERVYRKEGFTRSLTEGLLQYLDFSGRGAELGLKKWYIANCQAAYRKIK